jgi:hypothetical protein
MATVLIGEKAERSGTLTATDSGFNYVVPRTYLVQSDINDDGELNVLLTSGLPIIGLSGLVAFPEAICRSLRPRQNPKQPKLWEVQAEFSTAPLNQSIPAGGGGSPNPDPTTWIPIYKGSIEYYDEVIHEDFSTPVRQYVNSAGCKFPEPLVVKRPIIVFDFYQYESASTTDKTIAERNDCINNMTVTRGSVNYDEYTLKCTVTDFERGFYYGYGAVKVHYRVAYKPAKWLNKPLDMGYEYKNTAGELQSSPKLVTLNSDGTMRSPFGTISSKEFKPHKPISFAFLR